MATPVPQMLAKNNVPKKPTTNALPGVVPKANIPTAPTSEQAAHQAWINDPSSGQGGFDNYVKTQNQRWQTANESNDAELMGRLQADSQRVGYTLNPYSAPKPPAPAPTTPAPSSAPVQNPAQQNYFQYQKQLNDAMKQLKSYMQPMNYDPNTDPSYLAQKKLYENQAKQASQRSMEALNERGVLNSTMTAGEIADAEQNAALQSDAFAAQLQDRAYQRQQDQLNNTTRLIGLLGDMQQRGMDNDYRDRSFDRGVLESDRNFDRGVTESDRNYNRQVGRDAVGDEQWNRTYERQIDRDAAADSQWQQSFEYQRMSDQQKMDYQKARDQIKDEQYKQQFDEDVRRFGIDTALKQAAQANQFANAAADNARANRSLDLQERRFTYDKEQDAKGKQLTDVQISDIIDSSPLLQKQYDDNGKLTGSSVPEQNKQALAQYIASLGLPPDQAKKWFIRYGLWTGK